MERDINRFREEAAKSIKKDIRLERINATIAGVLIGIGVGGWVALGMDPGDALCFGLFGTSFALGGIKIQLERKHYQEEVNRTLERFGNKNSS